MPAWTLRRFSRISFLRQVNATQLYLFLEPYRDYWSSVGIEFPEAAPLPVELIDPIRKAIISPTALIPGDLLRALAIVDDLATEEAMDALLADLSLDQLRLTSGQTTPGDYMMAAWRHDRARVERHHAERRVSNRRSFVVYPARTSSRVRIQQPTVSAIRTAEQALDAKFLLKNRGAGAGLFLIPREGGITVMIRHGETLKRAESMRDGAEDSICYRPAKYDIAFVPMDGSELQITARSGWERDLYRTTLGLLLARNADAFTAHPKFTLEPLRNTGEELLTTAMVENLTAVALREVTWERRGEPSLRQTISSPSSLAMLQMLREQNLAFQTLVKAEFRFTFEGQRASHTVVIQPPDRIQISCDENQGVIEAWLIQKGFLDVPSASLPSAPASTLAQSGHHPQPSRRPKRVAV